jgi:excisionase family DNA binding protein
MPIDRLTLTWHSGILPTGIGAPANRSTNEIVNTVIADKQDKLLTVQEVAERLRVSESWVRCQIRAGTLPYLRLGGVLRLRWSDVERSMERNAKALSQ